MYFIEAMLQPKYSHLLPLRFKKIILHILGKWSSHL